MRPNAHARVETGALRETARLSPRRRGRPLRVCMLAYTFYELDARVMRYAEALVERGDGVDVIALRRDGQSWKETIKGVRVFRIQKRVINEGGVISYARRILLFFLRSMVFITRRHLKQPYQLIHVHSVPDFLVFAPWIPKLLGAIIILDIHDVLPELYASKFGITSDSFLFKCLVAIERICAAFAHHVIVANDLWAEKMRARSIRGNKCMAITNCPDETIFSSVPEKEQTGQFVILYPGTLNWHQGVDIAIRAFSLIGDQLSRAEFHIYGEGPAKGSLVKLTAQLGLQGRVLFREPVPVREIAKVMGEADLAVVPKRAGIFGNEAFSTKILEFMSVGVPVIVSETKVDRYYFNEAVVKFFKPGDEKDLARAILLLMRNKELRERLADNASKCVTQYLWSRNKDNYLDLVEELCRVGQEE